MQTDMDMAMRVAEALLGQNDSPTEEDITSAAESAVLALEKMGKNHGCGYAHSRTREHVRRFHS